MSLSWNIHPLLESFFHPVTSIYALPSCHFNNSPDTKLDWRPKGEGNVGGLCEKLPKIKKQSLIAFCIGLDANSKAGVLECSLHLMAKTNMRVKHHQRSAGAMLPALRLHVMGTIEQGKLSVSGRRKVNTHPRWSIRLVRWEEKVVTCIRKCHAQWRKFESKARYDKASLEMMVQQKSRRDIWREPPAFLHMWLCKAKAWPLNANYACIGQRWCGEAETYTLCKMTCTIKRAPIVMRLLDG